jgi:hypothetical protein
LIAHLDCPVRWSSKEYVLSLADHLVSYPSPEGEGLSAALSRSVSESEIYPGHFFIIEKQAEDPSPLGEGMNARYGIDEIDNKR